MLSTKRNGTPKGTRQTRVGRYNERNRIYHVITKSLDNEAIFLSFANARIVIDLLRQQQDGAHANSLAFVLMPDHLHWLMQITGERSLSTCVNAVKSGSTRRINSVTGRSGRLWQKGFYDHAIRCEKDVRSTARYIVANPLRAGIVTSVTDYPHWDAIWL
jgi:REP-associated tyrosine transposase